MYYTEGEVYHVYNRGNDKQQIFFDDEDYQDFLRRMKVYLKPESDLLCYCLMPNHFHFMLSVNEKGCKEVKGFKDCSSFQKKLGVLLSSYCQRFNRKYERVGSLFQQNTRAKCLTEQEINKPNDYLYYCMNYIHQNPVRAGLVLRPEEWEYSSFKDHAGMREETICSKILLKQLAGYQDFYAESYALIDEKYIRRMLLE